MLQCEKIHHEYALGYVDDNGVTMDLEQAAMQYNGYVKKYQGQCQNCSVRCHCGQCVFYWMTQEKKMRNATLIVQNAI
ncbi:hypothetical protein ACIXNK_17175 [Bacteroides fragilis]